MKVAPWLLQSNSNKEGFNAVASDLSTTEMTAVTVIPELALTQEGSMITPTLVETKQRTLQIMGTSTLKPWGIF